MPRLLLLILPLWGLLAALSPLAAGSQSSPAKAEKERTDIQVRAAWERLEAE